jgi:hypothetical protein
MVFSLNVERISGERHEGFHFRAVMEVDDKLPLVKQEVADDANQGDIGDMVEQPLADSDHGLFLTGRMNSEW